MTRQKAENGERGRGGRERKEQRDVETEWNRLRRREREGK
jgi:hypothetical protein